MNAALLALVLTAAPIAPEPALTPILSLAGEINNTSVAPLIQFFLGAAKRHTPAVVLELESNGGSNTAGYNLIDAMLAAEAAGTRVTCITGNASSMAAVIFETACTTRRIRLDGHLLFHETAFLYLVSEPGARLTKTYLAALVADIARDDVRCARLVTPHLHMTPEEYLAWIAGSDRYVDAGTALSRGFVDEIVVP